MVCKSTVRSPEKWTLFFNFKNAKSGQPQELATFDCFFVRSRNTSNCLCCIHFLFSVQSIELNIAPCLYQTSSGDSGRRFRIEELFDRRRSNGVHLADNQRTTK
ncbi:hypothetical protein RvY_16308, partial [Ramazzottius varieornatus]